MFNFFLRSPARIRLEWALGTGQQVSTHALATSRPPSLPRGGLGEEAMVTDNLMNFTVIGGDVEGPK
jgi:hypothetical protein